MAYFNHAFSKMFLGTGETRVVSPVTTGGFLTTAGIPTGSTNPATNVRFVKNYTNFVLPRNIQLLYNGTVYYDAQATSCQFWNLVQSETPSQLNATVLSLSSNDLVSTPAVRSWVEIPFGQVYEQLSGSHMYVAGKTIQNAVVNLQLDVPDDTKSYTLHAMYSYNCVMMVADGSVSYVF